MTLEEANAVLARAFVLQQRAHAGGMQHSPLATNVLGYDIIWEALAVYFKEDK